MLKTLYSLELYIENKLYRFNCDVDSNTVHIKEALFQFQKYIGNIEDQAKASQAITEGVKEENKEEPVPEEIKV